MFEIKMEPWESLPDNFEQIRQTLQHISYPLMPREPEVGKFYRIYPAGCVSGNGTAYHGGVRIGRDAKKLRRWGFLRYIQRITTVEYFYE